MPAIGRDERPSLACWRLLKERSVVQADADFGIAELHVDVRWLERQFRSPENSRDRRDWPGRKAREPARPERSCTLREDRTDEAQRSRQAEIDGRSRWCRELSGLGWTTKVNSRSRAAVGAIHVLRWKVYRRRYIQSTGSL